MKKNNFLICALLLLSSCSSLPSWLGSGEKPKLPGDRYAVMEDAPKIAAEPGMQAETVDIPQATTATPTNANTGNVTLSGDLNAVQSVSAGDEPENEFFLAFAPSVDGNTVFVIDGHSNISAYDAETLKQKWQKKSTASKKDRDLPGGGITSAYGVLYAATGYGEVVAVSETDGALIWKKNLGAPLRRAPIVANDKVFAATIDNQLFALSVIDGATLWRHSGVRETTSFYGSTSLAVKGDIVIAAYSSGEVFGINAPRGNELWTELVSTSTDLQNASSALNDVSASPVIADGLVYISSNSGDLTAFNATNGTIIWRQKIGSVTSTPWVAGKYIFAISQGNQLMALNRFDGRVKWVSGLPQSKKKGKHNFYSGPVMAGGKLLLISAQGKLLQYDPADGRNMQNLKIPKEIYSAPAIANGKLYMLTREAELVQVK